MKKKRFLISMLSLALTAAAVATPTQDGYSEPDQEDPAEIQKLSIEQVVVTATGTPRRLKESPVPIAVITAQDLKIGNILNLEDALIKLNPSFSVMTNGMGTTMSLNGMPDDYILFLVNGRRMNGANPYTQIDINRVKRIEVMSGAAAVMYGTNAIGGVVNIVTDDLSEDRADVSGSVQSHVSSYDRYVNSMDFTLSSGKFRSTTSYTHSESGGWQFSPYVESGDELVETEKEASTGYSRNLLNQEFQYDVNDKLSLNARGSYYDNITKRPYAAYSYNMHHEDYTYGLGADYKLKGNNRLSFDYHSDNYTSSYDYMKAVSSADAQIGDRIARSITHYHNANVKGYFFVGERHVITSGAEYEMNTLESIADDVDYTAVSNVSLFAQDEVKIVDNFYALAGARYTYHQTFNSHATAHASLRYTLKNFNFRASYSSGFRTPDLSDIFAKYESNSSGVVVLPNQDLQPEKSNYYSLNAEYNNKWLSFSATGFYNDVYDMIDYKVLLTGDDAADAYDGATEVRIRSNIARAEVKGVTLSLNAVLGAGFNFRAGYTGLDAVDLETGDPINRSVRNIITTNASWAKGWDNYTLNVAINGRWSDERYSSSYGYAPSYQLWDLRTQHSFKFDKIVVEPAVGIENLFDYIDDRPWNSNYATLTPGRSVYGSVTIRF
ncbi:MAG: TonB-dependent receptor [Rikenellaceae bacterium]